MTTMTEQLLDRAAQKAADTILLVYASSKGALKSEIVRAIKVEFATIQQVATPEAIGYLTHDSVKALLEMGRKQRSHRSTMVCNLPRHACCVPIYTAAPAQPAPDPDELQFNAQRLRNVAKLVGLESAVPKDDATLDGARGAVLGMIAAKLRERNSAAPAQAAPDEVRKAYDELIYAVARKWPGETRHQTALRYIRERETPSTTTTQAATPADSQKGEGE